MMVSTRNTFTTNRKIPKPLKIKKLEIIRWCCHFIRDCIVDLHANSYDTYKFPKTVHIPKPFAGEELYDFLEKKYPKEYTRLLWREIVMGLLNDFLHFTYTSLDCVDNFRITVAYATMRKPYQDTLKHLEYLLLNPKVFLETFIESSYKLDNALKGDNKHKLKENIEKVTELIPALKQVHEIIYQFRYEMTDTGGLYDQASHLFTAREVIRTEKSNINFVYLNRFTELVKQHSEHIYRAHLMLLLYSLELFSIHLTLVNNYNSSQILRFRAWVCYFIAINSLNKKGRFNISFIDPFIKIFEVQCPNCKSFYSFFNYRELKKFGLTGFYCCANCTSCLLMNDELFIPSVSNEQVEALLSGAITKGTKLYADKVSKKYGIVLPTKVNGLYLMSIIDFENALKESNHKMSEKQVMMIKKSFMRFKKIISDTKAILYEKQGFTQTEIDTFQKTKK